MTIEQLHAIKTQLEQTYFYWSERMREFPRSDMGLIPDNIRSTQEYKDTKAQCDNSFSELRRFNGSLSKAQLKQLRDYRRGL